MPTATIDQPFLDVHGAAKVLNVSHWTVRRYVELGFLKAHRLPGAPGKGRLRFTREDLEELMNRGEEPVD